MLWEWGLFEVRRLRFEILGNTTEYTSNEGLMEKNKLQGGTIANIYSSKFHILSLGCCVRIWGYKTNI